MFETLVRRLGGTNQSIGRFLIVCMAIGFASLAAAGIAAAWATARGQQHTDAVSHSYEVERTIAHARLLIEQAETPRRGYIIAQQPIYLETYRAAVAQLPPVLQRLQRLTVDNPRQQANLVRLRRLSEGLQAQREQTNALVEAGRVDQAIRVFKVDTSAQPMHAIRGLANAMAQEEHRLLAIRDAEQRASVRTFYVTLIVAAILLLAVALVSMATILRYTRDLATSNDAIRDFADSLEDLVKERTAKLSRANDEIQRFAYIISHDLRSPLVNVMGFTAELETATALIVQLIDRVEEIAPDLVTEEARNAAREDLPEAIGFIRTSTQKMDRLINAILKLSREGRRVIAPEPIDTGALVDTIRATLQHLLDDRDGTLIVEGNLPGIVTDRLAIEQIFSNLIENAIKYFTPGRPGRIIVRGSREGARVMFEIEDNGRGIDPRDHQRVFDLFRRSGSQDQPGEGIGLAHVRALAYRLGGIIDVRSELGQGATFRLSLPALLTVAQDNR
jgi:signal transduction histidine kinase